MKKRILSAVLVLTIGFSIFGTSTIAKAQGETNQTTSTSTQVGGYSTGLTQTTQEQNVFIAENAVSVSSSDVVGASSTLSLPNKVDNSTNDAFPNVGNQGPVGACSSFSTTYYQFSYMINRAEGRSGKVPENVYSPKWTYNLVNHGIDIGSSVIDNYNVLMQIGANNIVEVPFISSGTFPSNYKTDWHATDTLWQKAQKSKMDNFYTISLTDKFSPVDTLIEGPNDSDLDVIKTKLAEGDILSFSTYIEEWYVHKIASSTLVPENNLHGGEPICDWVGAGTQGAHAMSIVGYDDDIWTDLNRDGVVQAGENGAFKIVNSWGLGWNVPNHADDPVAASWASTDGFIWVSYDALNKVSSVPNHVYKSERQCFIKDRNTTVYGMTTKPISEESKLFAKFTLSSTKRDNVKFTLSAADSLVDDSNTNITQNPFSPAILEDYSSTDSQYNNNSGAYTFSGASSPDGTFYIDLDKVIKNIKLTDVLSNRWKLTVLDGVCDGVITLIKDFKIVDGINGKEYSANISTPIPINGNDAYVYVNPTVVNAPTNVLATLGSDNSINLSWTASQNAIGYKIYRDGNYVAETTSTSYVDKENGVNQTHKYEVKAKGTNGSYSLRSTSTSITSGNKVIIKYCNPNNWTNVYIHYCVGNGQWTTAPGKLMSTEPVIGNKQYIIDLGSATTAAVCFNNGNGSWDSNGGKNYTLAAGNYSINNGVATSLGLIPLQVSNLSADIAYDSQNKLYPDRIGNTYRIYASTNGGAGANQYRFSFKKDNIINVIRDYSSEYNTNWTPTDPGDYTLYVEVKDITGEVIRKELNYKIKPNELKLGNFIVNTSTEDTATDVKLFGYTIGGKVSVKYKYSVKNDTSTTVIQDYSSNSATTWRPSKAGSYTFIIEAMDETGKVVKQEKSLTIYNSGAIVNYINSSSQSPALLGGAIYLQAGASRGRAPYTYKFTVNGQALDSTAENAVWLPKNTGNYTISVTVTDANGNTNSKSIPYTIYTNDTITRVEETDPSITYAGTWNSSSNVDFSGGAVKYTSTVGSTSTFNFTGTGISIIGPKSTNRGIAKVTIDGTAYNMDMYNSTFVRTATLFQKKDLASGTHSLTIEYTGAKNSSSAGTIVNFDAFDIVNGDILDYTNRVDEANSKISYSGTWTSTSNSGYIGGTVKYTITAGAKLTFKFTGTGISIIGAKSINRGIAKVTIDGVVYAMDMYNSVYLRTETLFEKKDLASGTHTITIEYTGTKNASSTGTIVNLDAFDITNGNIV